MNLKKKVYNYGNGYWTSGGKNAPKYPLAYQSDGGGDDDGE